MRNGASRDAAQAQILSVGLSMKRTIFAATILVFSTVITLRPVDALPLTWTLNSVIFEDGGTATGSFDYIAGSNSVFSWDIFVSGGNTDVFAPFNYSSSISGQTAFSSLGDGQTFVFVASDFLGEKELRRDLRIFATSSLTDLGGTIFLGVFNVGNSFNLECFNCSPVREIADGAFIQSNIIPEPSTLALFAFGLAGLGFMMRRRRSMYLKAA